MNIEAINDPAKMIDAKNKTINLEKTEQCNLFFISK